MLLPEFYEADINLLFHKLQTGYYPKCRHWCIKSDIDREKNTTKKIPNDTHQLGREGLTSLLCLENGIQERSQSRQTLEINLSSTDSINAAEL